MDLLQIFIFLLVILLSLALHEFGHAAMADKLGDPTPRAQGRYTLNPIAHLDPVGTVFIVITMFVGMGIGWGKPVQINPTYFREFRKGIILVAIAGPAMNLCLAFFGIATSFIMFASGMALSVPAHHFLFGMVVINFGLIFFNMLPIPPLDGGNVLEQLLPWEMRRKFQHVKSYGLLIILALMYFRLIGPIIGFFFSAVAWMIQLAFGPEFLAFLFGGP
jgi:Zn-dependent protease